MDFIERYKQEAESRRKVELGRAIEEGRRLKYFVLPVDINEEFSVRNSLMWYIHMPCGRGGKPKTRNSWWTSIIANAERKENYTEERICFYCDPVRVNRVLQELKDAGFEMANPNQIPPLIKEYAWFRCLRCGLVFKSTRNSILCCQRNNKSHGCPGCCSNGFKVNEPAHLYVCGIRDTFYQKIGVTNKDVTTRYPNEDLEKFSFTASWKYFSGADALRDERFIKNYCKPWQCQEEERLLKGAGNSEIFQFNLVWLVEKMENGKFEGILSC